LEGRTNLGLGTPEPGSEPSGGGEIPHIQGIV